MKTLRYLLEAALLYTLYFLFGLMSPALASNTGGFIGRAIGPRLAASRKALRNLDLAMPGLDPGTRRRIIAEMWDNLGRVIAEYPHLETISRARTTVINKQAVEKAIAQRQGGMFFGAHLANWEVNIPVLLTQFGIAAHLTYRAANNPYSDRLLSKARTLNGRLKAFPKARSGGREILKALDRKEFIGILIDQKYNEGLAIPFFGMPAMTNPAFVSSAMNVLWCRYATAEPARRSLKAPCTIPRPCSTRRASRSPLKKSSPPRMSCWKTGSGRRRGNGSGCIEDGIRKNCH